MGGLNVTDVRRKWRRNCWPKVLTWGIQSIRVSAEEQSCPEGALVHCEKVREAGGRWVRETVTVDSLQSILAWTGHQRRACIICLSVFFFFKKNLFFVFVETNHWFVFHNQNLLSTCTALFQRSLSSPPPRKKTSENGHKFCQSGEQSSACGSDKHFNLKSDPTGVSDPEACTLYWHCWHWLTEGFDSDTDTDEVTKLEQEQRVLRPPPRSPQICRLVIDLPA